MAEGAGAGVGSRDPESLKRAAAERAVALVESGMRVGLGTGSTMAHVLDLLARRLEAGELREVRGVPTSTATAIRAEELGIPLGSLHELAPLDLAVDGADEVDPELRLVKGMGGALLREKMVAAQARRFVVVVDERKMVRSLGERSPLPVEVVAFAWQVHLPFLRSLGAEPVLRTGSDREPVRTDNGNLLLDARFPDGLADPEETERRLRARPGVVETGLFLAMASDVFVARPDGVEHRRREG